MSLGREPRNLLYFNFEDERLGGILAASACNQGISMTVTNNEKDFKLFGRFKILTYNQQENQ